MIECVNFATNDSTIRFKRLMKDLVYSPNSRFAVNLGISKRKVTSMLVLDPYNMQFHQYRNCSGKALDMDMFYWYTDDCLILIHLDENTKLHQTPVVLNHQTKTYEARKAVFYNELSSRTSFEVTSKEAQSIELDGKKFVLLVSDSPDSRNIFAVPHKPDSSIKIKWFKLRNDVDLGRINSTALETLRDKMANRNLTFFMSSQVTIINNQACFPIQFHFKNNPNKVRPSDITEILGVYAVVKLSEMPELSLNLSHDQMTQYAMDIYRYRFVSIVQLAPTASLTANDEYLKRPAIYRMVRDNLVCISEEKIDDEKVSTVTHIDFSKRTVSPIYMEASSTESEVAVCPTPYNILTAKKISITLINCSIIPHTFAKKKVSTLQEITLSKTYLNLDGKQKFAHTFII